jgi:hypothetical protein
MRNAEFARQKALDYERRLAVAAEQRRTGQWWQLSMTAECAFLGAAIVWARGITTATERAKKLGIVPEGPVEILGWPIPRKDTHRIPVDMRNRLVGRREFRRRLDGVSA